MFFSVVISLYILLSFVYGAVPEPNPYLLSFPTMDNPMNVKVNTTNPEKNYILLIGDWGASSSSDIKLQTAVANKMKSFYESQKSKGMNLLFVGTVGDNFYCCGQEPGCGYFTPRWQDMYGEIATNYPWFAVMGNHDWGNSDAHAICAWGVQDIPFIDPVTNIPYAGNQLNQNKKGCNPSNYYLPDYGYYYTINELNFEWIGLEETVSICPGDNGGQNYKDCNGSSEIGCAYLGEMRDASEQMMIQRANISKNSNFLIVQHYPNEGKRLVNDFTTSRNKNGHNTSSDIIWAAYGHKHEQECQGTNKNGHCNLILTGGGGGCCSEPTLRGFYVIGFDKNKNMYQPLKFNDPEISCQYPCGADITDDDILISNFEHCCHSDHGKECQLYDLTKC